MPKFLPTLKQNAVENVLDEYIHACTKHSVFPKELSKQLAILTEENLEVAQAFNKWSDEQKGSKEDIKKELQQVGAVIFRILENWVEEK